MTDYRDIFYKRSSIISELAQNGILEIAYKGNIGFQELVQFYMSATEEQINQLELLLKTNQIRKVVELIQIVTGVRLIIGK